VVRGGDEDSATWWSYSKTIYTDLLKHALNPDYGDFVNADSGLDITLTYTPKEKSPTSFAKTELMFDRKESPLFKDKKKVKEVLATIKPFEDIFLKKEFSEIDDALQRHLGTDGGASSTAERGGGSKSKAEAFDEAFADIKERK